MKCLGKYELGGYPITNKQQVRKRARKLLEKSIKNIKFLLQKLETKPYFVSPSKGSFENV